MQDKLTHLYKYGLEQINYITSMWNKFEYYMKDFIKKFTKNILWKIAIYFLPTLQNLFYRTPKHLQRIVTKCAKYIRYSKAYYFSIDTLMIFSTFSLPRVHFQEAFSGFCFIFS